MRNTLTQSVPPAVDIHRSAYNAAFYELGLKWHWDADTYRSLPSACETERIKSYLETHQPHLLSVYDAEFLVTAIESTKARCYATMAASASMGHDCNWAEIHAHEVGV